MNPDELTPSTIIAVAKEAKATAEQAMANSGGPHSHAEHAPSRADRQLQRLLTDLATASNLSQVRQAAINATATL